MATPGMEVCNLHGGKSLRGVASPSFKTGRYSKHLPGRLLERYNEAVSDPELLGLREDIGLLDSRLADMLKRVDTGESGAVWKLLKSLSFDLSSAIRAKDSVKQAEYLSELIKAINRGHQDYAAWGEVMNLLEQRRKLVESERKRLVEMQQYLTVERGMVLVTALIDSCRRHVHDTSALAAISADISRLIGSGSSGGTEPGAEVLAADSE